MRLKTIKLAGFKSFVDPTTVVLPSNLCGVVGPNGCGKSNIIDAVRWVLGEASAKHLRGESMADVIFNGSAGRKPLGQAAIELVFDNAEGKLGGEYASYAEIAIRRTVARDGVSQYFLNGARCRRRDITDIFLGTGLGPRSYAIIEQGMISRLIEAKPEELRVYIEEAAGISKYKERRRDTENRIRRTRENLERLTDLRDELERQLQHLKRQANAAERYTELKADERRVGAELLALQWRILDAEGSEVHDAIRRREVDLAAVNARHTRVDADIEKARERHSELNEAMGGVQ
ncbi:MAG: AAA family ATPase, partial [Pseudomonadales bacterium]